ncbi:MAG TPA: FecR domain-containing protein [Thermoanaerobaculia bacterium]|nr:FecR domain-containing protein [Thermoanaerobaculia bacterium]
MKRLFASLLTFAALPLAAQTMIDYRFDEVRRSVVIANTAKQNVTAAKGTMARSGDKVKTGLFSYALIAAKPYGAKFEIFSSSDVELAGNTPGVLLTLNRGTLHAIFDKITGNEPRIVQTPGALLAVRGTQYTVSVDAKGETNLDVFEGIVEVRSPLRPEPFLVRAGEAAGFSRRRMPIVQPMPPHAKDGNDPNHHGQGSEGSRQPGDTHGHGPDGHPMMPPPPGGGMGGAPRPPQPPSGKP